MYICEYLCATKCECVHGMLVKVFMAHMSICSKQYIPKMVHETN